MWPLSRVSGRASIVTKSGLKLLGVHEIISGEKVEQVHKHLESAKKLCMNHCKTIHLDVMRVPRTGVQLKIPPQF